MVRPITGLDNPALKGRLHNANRRSMYERRVAVPVRSRVIRDVYTVSQQSTLDVSPKKQMSAKASPTATAQSQVASSKPPARVFVHDIIVPARAVHVQTQPHSDKLHPRHMPSHVLKREYVQAPRSKKSRRPALHHVLTAAAVIVMIAGVGIGWHGLKANQQVVVEAKQLSEKKENVAAENNDVPSESNPPEVASYRVAVDLPRTIKIAKIGVNARVVRLGTNVKNQLLAPSNIFDSGWYTGSTKPGEAGATLIDGHVSGPTKRGVFYDLKKLVKGDQIQVERGDGKLFTYKVVQTKAYDADKVDMAAALTPVTTGKAGLNLITCSGEIDRSRNHYEQRLVVFAEQL